VNLKNLTNYLFKGIACILVISGILSCVERERTNIFDPQADINITNLKLRISSADTVITLEWPAPYGVEYTGFNLYRKLENEETFSILASLPPFQYSFDDSVEYFDTEYAYYLKIAGQNGESPPTAVVRTVPGPVSFWVLDQWYFASFNLTYDLSSVKVRVYGSWYPENMAIDKLNHKGMLTYTQFHYIEIFDTGTGQSLNYIYNLNYPYDCIYNPGQNNFWFTDSSGGIFSVDPESAKKTTVFHQAEKPTRMAIASDHKIYIIDRALKGLLAFNPDGTFADSIKAIAEFELADPLFIEPRQDGPGLYIIDQKIGNRTLYYYNPAENSACVIHENKYLTSARSEPAGDSLWVSINDPADAKLVQLSAAGLRLKELNSFSYISDFRINNYNGGLIVADFGNRKLMHLRRNGSVIGEYKERIYPHKVYNE